MLFGAHESIFDGVDGKDSLGRALCVLGGVVVLSAAPRGGLPAVSSVSVDDAAAMVGWAADHAGELGADAARLVLAGEASGAALVTAVARHASDNGWPPIAHQLLIDPAPGAPTSGAAPATVVTVSSDASQSLVDLANALRRSLQTTTRRRPRRPRSAGAIND